MLKYFENLHANRPDAQILVQTSFQSRGTNDEIGRLRNLAFTCLSSKRPCWRKISRESGAGDISIPGVYRSHSKCPHKFCGHPEHCPYVIYNGSQAPGFFSKGHRHTTKPAASQQQFLSLDLNLESTIRACSPINFPFCNNSHTFLRENSPENLAFPAYPCLAHIPSTATAACQSSYHEAELSGTVLSIVIVYLSVSVRLNVSQKEAIFGNFLRPVSANGRVP